MKQILSIILFSLCSLSINAQVTERAIYELENKATDFQNIGYSMSYNSDGKIYTYNNILVTEARGIKNYCFNPTGFSWVAIQEKSENIYIWSYQERNLQIALIEELRDFLPRKTYPTAVCYSSDAQELIVANDLAEITVYSTRDYKPIKHISTAEAVYSSISISPNDYYLATASGGNLDVWNFEKGSIRKTLTLPGNIKHVSFSEDSRTMAVSCGEGGVVLYDTRTFSVQHTYNNIGSISVSAFHPEGKYLALVKDENSILLMNLKTNRSEIELVKFNEVPLDGIKNVSFCQDNSGNQTILHNTFSHIIIWDASGLKPLYEDMLNTGVDELMNSWISQMDGESMGDYAIRVNDDTRAKQQALFTEQVATDIAKERVSLGNPFADTDSYDIENNVLNISFNELPPIALEVSSEELETFAGSDLEFSNAIYMLNEEDELELAYVEVINETTGKVYIYNNVKRKVIADIFAQDMEADFDFIPLDILQMVNLEGTKLEERKQEIVEEKKKEEFITDKTEITVNSSVQADVDASGNKIYNYSVGYQYDVQKGFSAQEDFPSGRYLTTQSNAAISMLQIIKQSIETDLSEHITEGKNIEISVTGTADSSPIRGVIAYNNNYGEYRNEPYYINGKLDNMSVGQKGGITKNEQLAFIRAAGVKTWLEENIPSLKNTNCKYIYKAEVASKAGGEFRRIDVDILIKDAF